MTITPFDIAENADWEEFVTRSFNGTFLHTRRFLSYHGDRFLDRSLIVKNGSGSILGVLPAAEDPFDSQCVTTHPGATYGGIVHSGDLQGERMLAALRAIVNHYRGCGYDRWRYKAVPLVYHHIPVGDDLYGLFSLGARRWRCDLSALVDLEHRGRSSHGRRQCLRKAEQSGMTVREDWSAVADFWPILQDNLSRRHAVRATHTLEEIQRLHRLFPDVIRLAVACIDDKPVAGATLFAVNSVLHLQYAGASEFGRRLSALDRVIEWCIDTSRTERFRYFDFGISTERDGRVLNQALHQYKTSFGAGTMVYEHYELAL